MEKPATEPEPRRSSVPHWVVDRRDSMSSTSSMSEKRSRKKRLPNELDTSTLDPKSPKSPKITFDNKKGNSQAPEDKFMKIFDKPVKDYADGRAIYRKMRNNLFFTENQQLLEGELDHEGTIYLCRNMHLRIFQENEVVYTRGDRNDGCIFLVYSGELETSAADSVSNKQEMRQSNFFSEHNKRVSRDLSEVYANKQIRPPLPNQDSPFLAESCNEVSAAIKFLRTSPRPSNSNVCPNPLRTLRDGDYFGMEALMGTEMIREETISSKTESILLMIMTQDIEYIKLRYKKEMVQRTSFFLQHVSVTHRKDADLKDKFFSSMEERMLPLGEILMHEGITAEHFYFLYQGKCEIQKKQRPEGSEQISPKGKGNQLKNMGICLTEGGVFLGEEILFNEDSCYNYTVKVVSAKAIFFKFEKHIFKKNFKGEIFSGIREKYLDKKIKHQEIYDRICVQHTKRTAKMSFSQPFSPKTISGNSSPIFNFGVTRAESSHDPSRLISNPSSPTHAGGESQPTFALPDLSSSRGFFPLMSSSSPRPLQLRLNLSRERTEKNISAAKNSMDILKEKMQTFYRQFPSKADRLNTEEEDTTYRIKSVRADFMAKSTPYEGQAVEIGPPDVFDEALKFASPIPKKNHHRNYTEDLTHQPDNYEEGMKDSGKKSKPNKFISDIESVKLNFGYETGKKYHHMSSSSNARTLRTSMAESTMGEGRTINKKINGLSELKQSKEQEDELKISSARAQNTIPIINSKIDLKALRMQFFDSTKPSMRDYLATYKKAHIQNKQVRNITDRLKLKDFEPRGQMKMNKLTNIKVKSCSPPPVEQYNRNLLASPEKKSGMQSPRMTILKKQMVEMKTESGVLAKSGGTKLKLLKVPKIPLS